MLSRVIEIWSSFISVCGDAITISGPSADGKGEVPEPAQTTLGMEGVEHGDGWGKARMVVRMLGVKGANMEHDRLRVGVGCFFGFAFFFTAAPNVFPISAECFGWREGCLRVGARTAGYCLWGPGSSRAVSVTIEQPLYI